LYKTSETIDDSRRDLLRTKLQRCRFYVKLFLVVNFVALHAPIVASLVNTILKGTLVLPLPSFMPFVDRNTLVGLILNYFFQFLTLLFSFLGFSTYDASVIFFSFQTVPLVGLLRFKVRELQNEIQGSNFDRKKFHGMLADIVELHVKYNEIVVKIGEFCLVPTFVGISANTLGLCACMMAMTSLNAGSTIILQLFLQIFIPCVMGEIIASQVSGNKSFSDLYSAF
jgi:7tm Odorant receptor